MRAVLYGRRAFVGLLMRRVVPGCGSASVRLAGGESCEEGRRVTARPWNAVIALQQHAGPDRGVTITCAFARPPRPAVRSASSAKVLGVVEELYWRGCGSSTFAMLTKWLSLTRLETRTKESNICASIWVVKTLMRNESKGSLALLRWEPGLAAGGTIDRSFACKRFE